MLFGQRITFCICLREAQAERISEGLKQCLQLTGCIAAPGVGGLADHALRAQGVTEIQGSRRVQPVIELCRIGRGQSPYDIPRSSAGIPVLLLRVGIGLMQGVWDEA
ncbi:hypothetical protein D3C71_1502250 [compost metagenome]